LDQHREKNLGDVRHWTIFPYAVLKGVDYEKDIKKLAWILRFSRGSPMCGSTTIFACALRA
jgi:hypothetical protein